MDCKLKQAQIKKPGRLLAKNERIMACFKFRSVLLLLLNCEVVAYHDPAAAGRWSYDPLRLPSSALFDPAGRPCSPQRRDSTTTPPPEPETRRESETSHVWSRNQTKRWMWWWCMCVVAYLPVAPSHCTEEWCDTSPVALLNSASLIQQEPAD